MYVRNISTCSTQNFQWYEEPFNMSSQQEVHIILSIHLVLHQDSSLPTSGQNAVRVAKHCKNSELSCLRYGASIREKKRRIIFGVGRWTSLLSLFEQLLWIRPDNRIETRQNKLYFKNEKTWIIWDIWRAAPFEETDCSTTTKIVLDN